MNPGPHSERVEEIFSEASDIHEEERREEYLRKACAGDAPLLARVRRLLESAMENEMFFQNADTPDKSDDTPGERERDRIGCYKLLKQIGEGGFGVVFLAEQEQPVRRKVALKILKTGMDTKQVIARFEAERQALALMDHPNIAKVLDAGTTNDVPSALDTWSLNRHSGRPYIVMELVHGVPITRFCDQLQLTMTERLELFITVCQAIQHAHQKGVIHRDIKPSNVLVGAVEDEGRKSEGCEPQGSRSHSRFLRALRSSRATPCPKIIDFGVAKALRQRLTQKTLFTNAAQMIGTPVYMSPEQAKMSPDGGRDVDTRSDVYSLGILLYELLTGTVPFPEERFKEVGYAEIQRIIVEEDPPRPSTVFSRSNGKSRLIAANRRCEPATLMKAIKSDLDWIVLKAIDKDRDRRYSTPLELVADLQRHLQNEPVSARPPKMLYKLQKFIKRNRVVVAAAAGVMVVGLTGLGGILWQAERAFQSEQKAKAALANAEASLRFVRVDLLSLADPGFSHPDRAPDRNLKLLSAIQLAASKLDGNYQDQPLVEAGIRFTVGKAFLSLGEVQSADTHLRASHKLYARHLGGEDEHTLEVGLAVAQLIRQKPQYSDAARLYGEILVICERTLGNHHDLTLQALNGLAVTRRLSGLPHEAQGMFEEVIRRSGNAPEPMPLTVLSALWGLVGVHYELGHFDQRKLLLEELYERARASLGPDNPMTLSLAVEVLNIRRVPLNQPQEVLSFAREILSDCLRVLGEGHMTTIYLLSELSFLHEAQGLDRLPLNRKVFDLSRDNLGPDHPYTLFEELRLGLSLADSGYVEEGEFYAVDALERSLRVEGPDTLRTRRAQRWLAGIYIAQGRYDEAVSLRRQVVNSRHRLLGIEDPWTQLTFWALANVYARQGKWRPAAELYQEYLPVAPTNVLHHVAGLTVSALTGDRVGTARVASLIEDRFLDLEPSEAAGQVALALLLVPDVVSDWPSVLRLTDRALESNRSDDSSQELAGMAAYRRDNWTESVRLLEALPEDSMAPTPSPGRFFLAMALHRLNRVQQAREVWQAATDRLETVMRHGDLGNTTTYPGQEWVPFASCILARHEAEVLLFGQPVSRKVDAGYLAAARQDWQPVRQALLECDWAARRRAWSEARHELRRAMSLEQFDYGAALFHFPELIQQAAAIYLFSEDGEGYEALCSNVLASGSARLPENLRMMLLVADRPSAVTRASAIENLLSLHARTAPEVPGLKARVDPLTLGLVDLRTAQNETALLSLRRAAEQFNLNVSGTAHAYASLIERALGRETAAQEHLRQAKDCWRQILESGEDVSPRSWPKRALLELALIEARKIPLSPDP